MKTCFILMPFGDPDKDRNEYELWSEIYEEIFFPTITALGFECIRADKISRPGNIISDIINLLLDSDLVIADLSKNNVNVYYELGVRHTIGKPTILISQNIDNIPFDLRSLRVVTYGLSPRTIIKFRIDLEKNIQNIFQSQIEYNSPLIGYISNSKLMQLLHSSDERKEYKYFESTLNKVEERLNEIKYVQNSLKEEIEQLTNSRKQLVESIVELQKTRSLKKYNISKIPIGGLWYGMFGRILITVKGKQVLGDYDWKGYEYAGHFKGKIIRNIILFNWWWDINIEKGNGFFIIKDKELSGGWFFDYQNVNLNDATLGKYDSSIHPWDVSRTIVPSIYYSDPIKIASID